MTATLFLNIHFWETHGYDLWMFWPILPYTVLLAAVALSSALLFYAVPALAARAARQPLLEAVENSIGSIPALGFRLCCVIFLAHWMARTAAIPALWWAASILPGKGFSEEFTLAAATMAFLFVTGSQSARTSAQLALFTNKLGIAILVAGMLRVHEGWHAALNGFGPEGNPIPRIWQGISSLTYYVAPLAFLAANFGHRGQDVKKLMRTSLIGIALPLFGVLLAVGVLAAATFYSPCYQPSLAPNVPMALWAHAAASSVPGRKLIVAITVFGALRFGVKALMESASLQPFGSRSSWVKLSGLFLAVTWLSARQTFGNTSAVLDLCVTCLVGVAAVLTADFLTHGWHRVDRVRRIDWVGSAALAASLACMPCWQAATGADAWSRTWLLPSYGIGLLVCLLGRLLQEMMRRRQPLPHIPCV